mmetsp:Transcript_20936/g.45233  ORF Transcript_20936/g.45233 Transcript_20936/m.45233 type:complete len:289 (+) Transcript_20936:78-944(+)
MPSAPILATAESSEPVAKRQRQSDISAEELARAREDLALCYQACAKFNLNEGVCNHLSLQLPGRDEFLLIAYGVHWSKARAADILHLNFDGEVLAGEGKPEITGFYSHRAMHRELGLQAAAVLHTHMPFATTLSALRPEAGSRIMPVHQNYLRFTNKIAYEDSWGGFFDGDEVADAVTHTAVTWKAANNGQCPRIMLCANHGVFAFGTSIADAWDNLYYFERLCEVQVRALSCVGGDLSKIRLMDEKGIAKGVEQEDALREESVNQHWSAMKGLFAGQGWAFSDQQAS